MCGYSELQKFIQWDFFLSRAKHVMNEAWVTWTYNLEKRQA